MRTDTIAAIATGMSNSGIGIVRVSGENSADIVDKIFRPGNKRTKLTHAESHSIHYGHIFDGEEMLDEVMVSVMKRPRSFTAENTVEINCHGGILIMNRILELVIRSGARLAEPGEFTKRAYLNGRIDLAQAEAVIDVISSKNDMALSGSVRQLKGSVSKKIKQFREEILYEIAYIESALDDPEHISLEDYPSRLSVKIEELIKSTGGLISSFDNGKILKEGINTVIVGKPNVGKSSLLNLLVGKERAIVTDKAGTTRDIIEECINLHGISLNIIDTAGIRFTEDIVEKIGVERARRTAQDADLVIYVVDSSVELNENDYEILELIQDKKCIILLNKTDLESVVTAEDLKSRVEGDVSIIKTSTRDNTGIDEFEKEIKRMFFGGQIRNNEEIIITNLRHKEALMNAHESLLQVKKSIENNMPEDFYSIDLMNAYSSLGFIIGEEVEEDLINKIFSEFCMGK